MGMISWELEETGTTIVIAAHLYCVDSVSCDLSLRVIVQCNSSSLFLQHDAHCIKCTRRAA